MRKLLAVGLVALTALWAPLTWAEAATFFYTYDLNDTSYQYGAWGSWQKGPGFIQTSGSSTTITAVSGSTLGSLAVGSRIRVNLAGVNTERTVVTAGEASIVVNSAVDLTGGYPWDFRTFAVGTAAEDGWVSTNGLPFDVQLEFIALTGTGGVDVIIECRGDGDASGKKDVFTANYSSTTYPDSTEIVPVAEKCAAIRVGLKWATADTAGTDSITVTLY